MSKNAFPDAWDDDWETVADKPEAKEVEPTSVPKLSKTQRRALHQQQQKELWDSAENPGRFHFLETQGVVPLKDEFKPQVKLLSRKPTVPQIVSRKDTIHGVTSRNLEDDDDSEEEARKAQEPTLKERQEKTKREREQKQRKYDEARARIMGKPNTTPPATGSRESSHGRNPRARANNCNIDSYPTSSTDPSPARVGSSEKTMYDPNDLGKRTMFRRDGNVTPKDEQPMRAPRGPDGSGRGGFGFASRGGKPAP